MRTAPPWLRRRQSPPLRRWPRKADSKRKTAAPTGAAVFMGAALRARQRPGAFAPLEHFAEGKISPQGGFTPPEDFKKTGVPASVYAGGAGLPSHGSGEGNRRRQGAGRGRLIPNVKQPPQPGRLFSLYNHGRPGVPSLRRIQKLSHSRRGRTPAGPSRVLCGSRAHLIRLACVRHLPPKGKACGRLIAAPTTDLDVGTSFS